MLIQLIFLTLALSVDSFGIGISYGIRKIDLKVASIIVISLVSLIFSTLSICLGEAMSMIFTEEITSFISILILIVLGIFIIKKGMEKDKSVQDEILPLENEIVVVEKNIYSIFIKSLGITINVIKTPSSCDFDKSSKIDPKEALYLGIALSLDSFSAGIAIYSLNSYAFLFPILIMIFQLIFLCTGIFIAKRININMLDEKKVSIVSGFILIIMGFLRMIM